MNTRSQELERRSEAVEALNCLLHESESWEYARARKEHTDLFGVRIADRELYLKRRHGQAWDDVIKLSETSMDHLIHCLDSRVFWTAAAQLQKERDSKLRGEPKREKPV